VRALVPPLLCACTGGERAGLPLWLVAIGWVNALVYLGVSNVVIFLFWKTNYRVRTVADRRQMTGTVHPILNLQTS
jgi:hypothetical protein